jgi:hypothetical protein
LGLVRAAVRQRWGHRVHFVPLKVSDWSA